MKIDKLVSPSDLEEAYQELLANPDAILLGGCGYLKLADRTIDTAIDLSTLGLDCIEEKDDRVEISAMSTLRGIETSAKLGSYGHHVLAEAVRHIVGVQLRQTVTIGGSVAGRYPFSDPIVALLALDARLVFYKNGELSLQAFLNRKPLRDILVKIVLPKNECVAAFSSIRKARTDYAVLNAAVAKFGSDFRVVVGSRPARAVRALKAEDHLRRHGLTEQTLTVAADLAAQTVAFGSNQRGSAEYRKTICPVLVKRILTEVMNAA